MRIAIVLATLILATPALAQFWTHYANARFGYELDIPPGYEGAGESANGDGQAFHLPGGLQELTVWGGWLVEPENFEQEAAARIAGDMEAGWALTDTATTPHWAGWSGVRGDRMMHQRMIALCEGDGFAALRADYPATDFVAMQPVLDGLARSFAARGC